VLGKVRGALGDVVFRERSGKSFVGVRPTSFIPGTDPASVARREKFLLAVKFSQAINSESKLRSLWNDVRPPDMSTFNSITKSNYYYVDVDSVSDFAKIVPALGFGITTSSAGLSQTGIRIVINPIGLNTQIDPAVEVNIQLVSVLFFSTPLDQSVQGYYLTNLVGSPQPLILDESINFDVPLLNEQTLVYNKFQNHKAFVVLVTLDVSGKPVHNSSTIVLR
jgi:hypothetical protein